jgi:hypothetical protein
MTDVPTTPTSLQWTLLPGSSESAVFYMLIGSLLYYLTGFPALHTLAIVQYHLEIQNNIYHLVTPILQIIHSPQVCSLPTNPLLIMMEH